MPDTVDCCPGCSSASIRIRSSGSETGSADEQRYVCSECNAWFGEPDTRNSQDPKPGLKGLAAKLAATDPDAVGGEAGD